MALRGGVGDVLWTGQPADAHVGSGVLKAAMERGNVDGACPSSGFHLAERRTQCVRRARGTAATAGDRAPLLQGELLSGDIGLDCSEELAVLPGNIDGGDLRGQQAADHPLGLRRGRVNHVCLALALEDAAVCHKNDEAGLGSSTGHVAEGGGRRQEDGGLEPAAERTDAPAQRLPGGTQQVADTTSFRRRYRGVDSWRRLRGSRSACAGRPPPRPVSWSASSRSLGMGMHLTSWRCASMSIVMVKSSSCLRERLQTNMSEEQLLATIGIFELVQSCVSDDEEHRFASVAFQNSGGHCATEDGSTQAFLSEHSAVRRRRPDAYSCRSQSQSVGSGGAWHAPSHCPQPSKLLAKDRGSPASCMFP